MKPELFAHVLEQIKSIGVMHLHLTNPQGEPLLHPHAIEFIRTALRYDFDNVHLNTNLTPLTDEKILALGDLAQSGRFNIQASFSGYDKASHESVYVGSDFHETSEKLRKLAAAIPNPTLMVLGTIYDPADKEKNLEYLESLGIQRYRVTLQLPDNFAGYANHQGSFKKDRQLHMCHLLEHFILVYYDGEVSACACRDSEGVMAIGDLTQQTFLEIIQSKRYQDMLSSFRRLDLSNLPLCQKCDVPYGDQDSLRI